jgi:hypothetical protein
MRTLFEIAPFRRPEFAPTLGADWSWLTDLWTTGKELLPTATSIYKEYTSVEKAEEARKAAEAAAAAAAAQARATAQTQTAAQSRTEGSQVLGIDRVPRHRRIGLAAIAIVVAIAA